MLRQRVITALVMVGLFLAGVLFLPLNTLAVVFGVLVLAGGWEWSRMAGWESALARGLFVAVLALTLVALGMHCQLLAAPSRELVQPVLGLACLWWSFALLWVKSYPGSAIMWGNRFMRSLMGLLILGLTSRAKPWVNTSWRLMSALLKPGRVSGEGSSRSRSLLSPSGTTCLHRALILAC